MDPSVFNAIHSIAGQFGILDALIVFFAKYFGYFLVLGAAIFIYKEKDWHKRFYYFALSVLTIIISRGILAEIIRFFYFRLRRRAPPARGGSFGCSCAPRGAPAPS